ncbi:unnamed protein product [Polarella glacialis]|uniref:Uncharacterized protein n=1 Tax=Polarella glacialis TaxID=89957 RepID=A0A813IE19_POLGL|nr:unnamed protein product [Polarella glacialis]
MVTCSPDSSSSDAQKSAVSVLAKSLVAGNGGEGLPKGAIKTHDRSKRFDWEGVRRAVGYLQEKFPGRTLNAVVRGGNFLADHPLREVDGLRQQVRFVVVPPIHGGVQGAERFAVLQIAQRYGCEFIDNENYADSTAETTSPARAAILQLQRRFAFDDEACFALEGDAQASDEVRTTMAEGVARGFPLEQPGARRPNKKRGRRSGGEKKRRAKLCSFFRAKHDNNNHDNHNNNSFAAPSARTYRTKTK